MTAFPTCLKIHRFNTISFPKTPPSKTVSCRSNTPPVRGMLMKNNNVSDLHSLFSDKSGLTMTVSRGSQVSDRFFNEPSEGILARQHVGILTSKRQPISPFYPLLVLPSIPSSLAYSGWWTSFTRYMSDLEPPPRDCGRRWL